MNRYSQKMIRGKELISLAFLFALLLFSGCISTDMGGYINLPPLLTYTPHDPVTGEKNKIQALGPLLESWEKPRIEGKKERFFAFRPLVSYEKSPEETKTDLLWPFSAFRETRRGSFFWCFPYFQFFRKGGGKEFFFFPLLYFGQDAQERNSFFLFPLYGKLQSGFTGKNTEFILFPLYSCTRHGMTVSYNGIWPILHYEESPRHKKMRFFPLVAFREDFHLRRHFSFFWPLFNYAYSIAPKTKGFAFLSVPLGGYESWGKIRNGSILWPFFTWQETKDGMNFNGPWPFFRYGKNKKGAQHHFLWPLVGSARIAGTSYSYFLWPTGFYLRNGIPGKKSSRFLCLLPFYLSHTAYSGKGKIEKSYRHLYPFFSRRKVKEEVFQKAPDLTPIRKLEAGERNFLPLFTFFSSYSNKKGISWEILWGMARHIKAEKSSLVAIGPFYMHKMDQEKDSLLLDIFFGCVKVYKRGKESCVRLFHLVEIGKVSIPDERGKEKKK